MYSTFAALYDSLSINVPYHKFVRYYQAIFKKFEKTPHLILELGCGTGNITALMAKRGYDMTALDISLDMLAVAGEKCRGLDVLFLNQDMAEFELYGTVDVIFSALDCLNYLTDSKKLTDTLSLVKNYLNPGGLFIFDINSYYKISRILAGNTFSGGGKGVQYIWQNYFDKKTDICEFYLTFFVRRQGGLYEKFVETHAQRAYRTAEIKAIIRNCGLKLQGCFDEFSFNPPTRHSERIFFVLEKEA